MCTNLSKTILENRICAPIIIPTLNRHEHLKKCIESLQKNKLAKQTELFISVDFPPNEKYKVGYEKVVEYLQNDLAGFKRVNIFFQKENLGPYDNSTFLINEVIKNYNEFIYTEDDNIFSENYLEYMNLCLEKYRNHDNIYAISGYSYPIKWDTDRDAIILESLNFSGWGYGTWKKEYLCEKAFTREEIFSYLKDFHKAFKLYKDSRNLFNQAVYIASGKHYLALFENGELNHIDIVHGLYMYMHGKSMIMPALSKVRNMGHDGTGQNCKVAKSNDNTSDWYNFAEQEIDLSENFLFDETKIIDISQSHIKQFNNYFRVSHKTMFKAWIIWLLKIWLKKSI